MIDGFVFICRGSSDLLLFGVTAQIPKRVERPPRVWPAEFGYGELAAQMVASASIVFILLLVIVKSYRRARKLYPVRHIGIVTNQVVSDVVGAKLSMWRFVVWAGLCFIAAYPNGT